jgi:tetratricopeptide (TPR) repeat protein
MLAMPAEPRRLLAEARARGVEYILRGSVSRDGQDLSLGLVDVTHDGCNSLWSATFKRGSDQSADGDRLAAHIADQLDPAILYVLRGPESTARGRARAVLPSAIRLILNGGREKSREAARLINRALEISPDDGRIVAWAAFCKLAAAIEGWAKDADRALREARHYARLAVRLDPTDHEALAIAGHVASFADKDFPSAVHRVNQAVAANPHSAVAQAMRTAMHCYIGEPDMALESLWQYQALLPFDPHYAFFFHAIVYTFAGDYERAVTLGRHALRVCPDLVCLYRPIVCSLGHLGRREEAKPYLARLRTLHPDLTVEQFGRFYPFQSHADRIRYMDRLSRAGMREH